MSRIVQLMPVAPGWTAMMGQRSNVLRPHPLLCWALVDDNGIRTVQGVILDEGKIVVAGESGFRIVQYFPPGEEWKTHD